MNTTVRYSLPLVVAFLCLLSAFAAAPAKLDDTAPVADIVLEVDGKIAQLEKALTSDETFEAAKDKDVIQSFADVGLQLLRLWSQPPDEFQSRLSPLGISFQFFLDEWQQRLALSEQDEYLTGRLTHGGGIVFQACLDRFMGRF